MLRYFLIQVDDEGQGEDGEEDEGEEDVSFIFC